MSFGVSPQAQAASPGPLQLKSGPPYRSRLYLCLYQLPRRPQSWRRLSVDGSAHWLYSARSRSIASTDILPHRSGWSALPMPWMPWMPCHAMPCLPALPALPCPSRMDGWMYWGLGSPSHGAMLRGTHAICSGTQLHSSWYSAPDHGVSLLLYILFLSLVLVPSGSGTCSLLLPHTSLKTISTKSFTRSSHSSTSPALNSQSVGFPQPHLTRNPRASPPTSTAHSSIVSRPAATTYTALSIDPRADRQSTLDLRLLEPSSVTVVTAVVMPKRSYDSSSAAAIPTGAQAPPVKVLKASPRLPHSPQPH